MRRQFRSRGTESVGFDRPPRNAVLERQPVEKLHGDERLAVLVVNFVDGADVGMVQRRGGVGFTLKTGRGLVGPVPPLRAGT